MKKKPVKEDSDEFEADEPEEFDESGSDWDPEEEQPPQNANQAKKRKGRAKAPPKKAAPAKKKKGKPASEEDEEEEEEEEEDEEGEESDAEDAPGNGTFVVLKTDFKAGGNHPLWKIDGKALLQKFIPYEEDGKTLYKNTSTYSGWTQNNRNQYTPAPVKFIVQSKKEVIIEFLRGDVNIDEDSAGTGAAAKA